MACTLFFPDEERAVSKPMFCGPDAEGMMKMAKWIEVPKLLKKVALC